MLKCNLPLVLAGAVWLLAASGQVVEAGVIFSYSSPTTLAGGARWDAAPRSFNFGGQPHERSLQGGLRYSLEGGSFQAYRDMFTWDVVPSLVDFQAAVAQAFNAWGTVDPASGLGTQVYFVADLATPVFGAEGPFGGLNPRGAEIDLFASDDSFSWELNESRKMAETYLSTLPSNVTLTSGTTGYSGEVIRGVDIIVNNNNEAVYSLDFFRRLLTHEIGHSLGLGDVEDVFSPNGFMDDNYDGSTDASVLSTLTNSWALLVDPYNPAASPLQRYSVNYGTPGTTTPGLDILMESFGLGIGPSNPESNLVPLTNDEYGTRQFLYPQVFVPEPSTAVLLAVGVAAILRFGARSRPVFL